MLSLLGLALLLWGCATEPAPRSGEEAAKRRVDLVVRDVQAEVSALRLEVAAARIAAAKKEAELPELRRQVAELQRTAEAKQAELAGLRSERDRLVQTKTDLERRVAELQRTAEAKQEELARLEGQLTELPLPQANTAEVADTRLKVAETQTKLKELETTQAALTTELAQMRQDLARTRDKAGGRAEKPAAKTGSRVALMPSDRRPVRIAVERGDTLELIGQLYGVSVPALMEANGLRSDLILVGQELVIPRAPGTEGQPGANGK